MVNRPPAEVGSALGVWSHLGRCSQPGAMGWEWGWSIPSPRTAAESASLQTVFCREINLELICCCMSEALYERVKTAGQEEFKEIGPLSVQNVSSLKIFFFLLHFHFKHHFIDTSDILIAE